MIKELINHLKESYKQEILGWKVIFKQHSLERDLQRVELSPNEFENLLKKTIIFFDNCKKCLDSEYLIYSREKEQGFIIELNKENQSIKLITILPPKRQLISNKEAWKTQKIFIEKLDKFYDKDLTEYAILNDNIFRVDEANKWISCEYPILILEDEKIF